VKSFTAEEHEAQRVAEESDAYRLANRRAIRVSAAYTPMVRMGVALGFAGGLAYTAGVGFFVAHRMRYAHFVWHLFVVAGTTCHVIAVIACTL